MAAHFTPNHHNFALLKPLTPPLSPRPGPADNLPSTLRARSPRQSTPGVRGLFCSQPPAQHLSLTTRAWRASSGGSAPPKHTHSSPAPATAPADCDCTSAARDWFTPPFVSLEPRTPSSCTSLSTICTRSACSAASHPAVAGVMAPCHVAMSYTTRTPSTTSPPLLLPHHPLPLAHSAIPSRCCAIPRPD